MIVLSSTCSRLNLWDKPNTITNTLVSFLWTDKKNAAIHLKMEKVRKEAETDQGMDASLMNLAWGSYRAYISVHVSLTLFLCARPMGSNEMAMILVLLFWFFFSVVGCLGFCWFWFCFVPCCPEILEQLYFHMWRLSWSQWLSHRLCSFIMWIFLSILPFVLLQWQAFKGMSKGWIPVFKSWKGVYCRCCLLNSLPSHYPLGCLFLLTLEQARE